MKETLTRSVVVGIFALTVLTGLLVELVGGVWPGRGLNDMVSPYSMRSGRYSALVEQRLDQDSVVRKAVLPVMNEAMYRLFHKVAPQVVMGEDGWLFLASTVLDYPSAEAASLLPDVISSIGKTAAWLEAQGTKVLLVVPPTKAALHPDKLPAYLMYQPVYGEVIGRLRDAGLDVLDVRDVLPTTAESHYANDTHWTQGTALATALELDRRIRAGWDAAGGGPLPGTPVDGELHRPPEHLHSGDLTLMLGLLEGGALEKSFHEPQQLVIGRRRGTEETLGTDRPQPIALSGTSYSHGYGLAAILSALLGREVEKRTGPGQPSCFGVAGIVRQSVLGERPFPRFLVWEIPERYFFLEQQEILSSLANVLRVADMYPAKKLPLAIERRELIEIETVAEDAAGLTATANWHARIIYHLAAPLTGDGSLAIAFSVTAEDPGVTRVYLDTGGGFSANPDIAPRLDGLASPTLIVVPLVAGRPVLRMRIDPIHERGEFHLSPIELWQR
ncbi:MAG: hypothetical protein V2A76_13950 [Planctomycetota bacterium]